MATETHELFASKVKIDSPTGCWIWTGTKNMSGYGVFKWSKNRTGAHRFSWKWFNGRDVPTGMMVLHSCHHPDCVNPLHLRLGTHLDNMKDRRLIGNYLRGEHHVNSTITNDTAKAIFNDRRTCRLIANDYGINRHVVQNIRTGKTYVEATGGGRSQFQYSKGRGPKPAALWKRNNAKS